MKKELYLYLIFSLILCIIVTISASATEIVLSGECGAGGDNVTYTLDTSGVLTISGTGKMQSYVFDRAPWYGKRDEIKKIIIEDGVTTIGEKAFCLCSNLLEVIVLESVVKIEKAAFIYCDSLEEMILPFVGLERGNTGKKEALFGYIFGQPSAYATLDGTVAQRYALGETLHFYIPNSLKKVTITDETFIGYGAFSGNFDISEIILQDSVEGIGKYAFADHDKFIDVIIKNENVKFADYSIFSNTSFVTLYGYKNSTVQEYASKYYIDFEALKREIVGDCDGDEAITIDDAIHLAFYTFYPDRYPIPNGMDVDFNNDGEVTIDDAIYLAFYTFYPDRYPINK